MPSSATFWDRAYDRLFSEKPGARACDDLTAGACRVTPRNFFAEIAALTFAKLGDALASSKTILPWLLSALGAPVGLIGWLVPVRESLSMLPQIGLAAWIRRFALRKWIWVAGGAVQAAAVAGMAVSALTLRGAAAGFAVLACLIGFSLARAFCSIAIKDVQGKTIARRRRGRLTGWSSSAAGGLTLAASLVLIGPLRETREMAPFVAILLFSAALWLAAMLAFALVREFPAETAVEGEAISDALAGAWKNLGLLASEPPFRRFVAARALFLVSALSAPYYVVMAREAGGNGGGGAGAGLGALGWFVLAGGIADMISSPVWGHFADRSSRRVMMTAAGLASGLGIVIWSLAMFVPDALSSSWPLIAAFFLLSVAHAGVRAGRQTYIVDLATGDRRTEFVSVGNTIIGAILLLTGVLTPLAGRFGAAWLILLLSVAGVAGVILAMGLPEVEDDRREV